MICVRYEDDRAREDEDCFAIYNVKGTLPLQHEALSQKAREHVTCYVCTVYLPRRSRGDRYLS